VPVADSVELILRRLPLREGEKKSKSGDYRKKLLKDGKRGGSGGGGRLRCVPMSSATGPLTDGERKKWGDSDGVKDALGRGVGDVANNDLHVFLSWTGSESKRGLTKWQHQRVEYFINGKGG